jgi:hypothetical protein
LHLIKNIIAAFTQYDWYCQANLIDNTVTADSYCHVHQEELYPFSKEWVSVLEKHIFQWGWCWQHNPVLDELIEDIFSAQFFQEWF